MKIKKSPKDIILHPEYEIRSSYMEGILENLSDDALLSLDEQDKDTFNFYTEDEYLYLSDHIFEFFHPDQLDEKVRPLTYGQRLKRAAIFRKYANKIKVARERARTRRASPDQIKGRARKKAIEILRAIFLKGRRYADLSVGEKNELDKRMSRLPDSLINRIALKQIPVLRQLETTRLAAQQSHGNVHEEVLNFMEEVEYKVESTAVELAKSTIQREKDQDKIKFQRIKDLAKEQDKRTRQIHQEQIDPTKRFEGTDELAVLYKKETPGQS